MDIELVRAFCLALPSATESTTFEYDTLAFKVVGKIFALLAYTSIPPSLTVKCDPERAVSLRAAHAGISPAYYLNKKYWNSLSLGDSMPPALVYQLVQESYKIVVAALPKATRATLVSS